MTGSKGLSFVRGLFAVLVLLCAVFQSDRAFAQRPGTAEGWWSGTVRIPNGPLDIRVWLNRNPQGAWGGTIDIPKESMADYPLVVTGEGRSTKFRFPGGDASPTFTGTLSADANKITGNFTREGSSFPFEMTRVAAPVVVSPADKTLAHARRVVDLLRQEKFADVTRELNAQAAAALSTATLRERWLTLRTQIGAYKSEISQSVQQGPVTVVLLGGQFERGTHNIVVVFDKDEKIVSLQFAPRPAASGARN